MDDKQIERLTYQLTRLADATSEAVSTHTGTGFDGSVTDGLFAIARAMEHVADAVGDLACEMRKIMLVMDGVKMFHEG